MLSACASRLDLDPATTGSIAAPPAATAPAAAPTDDWEAVRRKIVAAQPAPAAKSAGKPLAWENADSGNSGTITQLIASSSAGRPCRNFAATLASVDGVRAYRGELCRSGGDWEYTRLEPLDHAAEARPKS